MGAPRSVGQRGADALQVAVDVADQNVLDDRAGRHLLIAFHCSSEQASIVAIRSLFTRSSWSASVAARSLMIPSGASPGTGAACPGAGQRARHNGTPAAGVGQGIQQPDAYTRPEWATGAGHGRYHARRASRTIGHEASIGDPRARRGATAIVTKGMRRRRR